MKTSQDTQKQTSMEFAVLQPKQALNKAFLKVKPNRSDIERFKTGLTALLDEIKLGETEEFHKNLLTDFLKKTGYEPRHFINTKGRNDLVIHNGDKAKSPVGVIIETKNPGNQGEMLRLDNINTKALQELLLYYLRERITNNNLEIRHIIATNVYEWFIFDAQVFEECFARDKELVRVFRGFDDGRLAGKKTDFFYKKIAPLYIDAALDKLSFTYVDLRDFEKPLRDASKQNDAKLIPLLKILSPEHLLKLPFSNDSNTLDKRFYTELLHIIGLTERKEGGKKLIERKPESSRDAGSLLENAIVQLDALERIPNLKNPGHFGADKQEQLFNVALELAITWINRVLFLKLLEAQLISYHKGDQSYAFLNKSKVGGYDDLNSLFFQVLARTHQERSAEMRSRFGKVPYLNSSLFEPAPIENDGFFISQIKDRALPLHPATVLKNSTGHKRTGEMDALEYLFEFLDAYDFTAEGSEEIQEDNKTLINASVLGLIFEKINGYKDGSFFTPGFITMYMCRETIRRAVLQKFNDAKGWKCETAEQLADKIDDKAEANIIINSLKICDPAVGSGHFLVSALNEIIALKSELGILCDREGKRLKNHHVEIVNDELIITDEDGDFFQYKPKFPESQRIQEALFHEKETIIENCLFGVDINPNSVKICRLRLWIELLKNAYYKNETELETLPNIDINIKCGNSLISRFALDADLKFALRNSKWNISSYRLAVMSYRNAESKEQKRKMEELIHEIQKTFFTEIQNQYPRQKNLDKLRAKLLALTQTQMFEMSPRDKAAWDKKVKETTAAIDKLENEAEASKNSQIYENAFEWRYEFPEVLADDGGFIGFDVVIGNPPYVQIQKMPDEAKDSFANAKYRTYAKTADLYCLFFERGTQILRKGGLLTFISSNKFFRAGYGKALRSFLNDSKKILSVIDFGELPVFEEAATDPSIMMIANQTPENHKIESTVIKDTDEFYHLPEAIKERGFQIQHDALSIDGWTFEHSESMELLKKIRSTGKPLNEVVNERFYYGIKTGLNEAFVVNRTTRDQLIAEHQSSAEILKPFVHGADAKKWIVDLRDDWLIYIPWHFPLHLDASVCGPSEEAEELFKKRFPAIYKHLLRYKTELLKRNAAETGIRYEWYALQRWGAEYWQEFEQPKILFNETSKELHAFFDESGLYTNKTLFMLVAPQPKPLLAVLLSRTLDWLFRKEFPSWGDPWKSGRVQFRGDRMATVPIPDFPAPVDSKLSALVDQIVAIKKENPEADVSALEAEIDRLVYKLYNLTDAEIAIIEKTATPAVE
ncbi:MAG: class I SAM-dependent DNA methyltransferase [Kiritimatiellia bacterium]